MKKTFKIIEKVIMFISLVAIIFGITIIILYNHKNEDGIFKFGDIFLISINDNDMSPEFNIGDLTIIKKKDISEYHINNIICYYIADCNGNITTKISKIIDGYSNNNETSYIFMLKPNDAADKVTISGGDIIGEWTGTTINQGGVVINFITTRLGLLVCTILPLFILFVIEFILLIITYLNRDKSVYNI